MANVLHRTTLEYRRSVNSPDFPDPPWLHNPDMSSVAGVPKKYWKLVGDSVQEMTQPEKDAVAAAEAAARTAELRTDADSAVGQNRDGRSLVIRAVAMVILDEINTLRALHSLPARTKAQMVTAVKAKIAAGEGEA